MDAFFVHEYDFVHPYPIKLWTTSDYENAPFLLTYDGVKLRVFNYNTHQLIKERDYLSHDTLSSAATIFSPLYPSRCIFILIRDRRNLIAFDENLNEIKAMFYDTTIIILSKIWSPSRQTFFVSGNFGWIRALKLTIKNSISGTIATWEPGWSAHEKNAWVQHLAIDEKNQYLIGSSGTEVICFNINDGSVVFRFNSQHEMDISSLCYSDKRLILYTAAPDGYIKGWRLFDKKPQCTLTIKQVQLGPILMKLDENSIITISHERILRRYYMMSSNPIAELNLDVTKPNEEKDVEAPIFLDAIQYESRQLVFESEGLRVSLFEALYAPSELAICCDIVNDIIVDSNNVIYSLCRNNVMHELHADGNSGATYDLDQIDVQNLSGSHTISQKETTTLLKDDVLYIGYEGGQIRVFDLKTHKLNEMIETNREIPVSYLTAAYECFNERHVYCPGIDSTKNYRILSDSFPGSFIVHCARCFNFVGSWNLSAKTILRMEQVPETNLYLCLEKERITLLEFRETILPVDTSIFDEFDIGHTFVFATNDVICVSMQSGKAYMYKISTDEKKIIHTHSMRLFDAKIAQLVSCKDLEHLNNGKTAIENENLNGIVCALSVKDKFVVADAFTGIIQYSLNFPKHKDNMRFSLVLISSKPFIVLSVDQNMRLLAFPCYQRIVPQIQVKEEETKTTSHLVLQPYIDDDDEIVNNRPYSTTLTKTLQREQRKEQVKEETLERDYTKEAIELCQKTKLVIPEGENKKTIRFKYQNGWPTIVIDKVEEEEEKGEINKEEEEEEEKSELPYNDDYKQDTFEFTDRQDIFLGDIIKQKQEKTADEVDKKNREVFEKVMALNPVAKEKIETKPLKSISRVEVYSDDEYDSDFYSTFLTLDVRAIQTRHNSRPNSASEKTKPKFDLFNHEKPKGIKPIKRRKPRKLKPKKYMILEFQDGTKIKADEKTAALLMSLTENAKAEDEKDEGYNTPGLIFQKALKELDKKKISKPKKLLIQEQQLLALPIQTLTNGGFSIGATNKRYFKKAPFSKFVTNQTGGNSIISLNKGTYSESPFFHWEGVNFDNDTDKEKLRKKLKKLAGFGVISEEESIEEEEEEEELIEEEEDDYDKKLRKYGQTTDSSISQDSVGDLPSGGLFDKSNPKAAKILNNSPQIQAIDKMFGDSDNPLLDFLNQAPTFSTDEIIKEINDFTPNQPDWHPMPLEGIKGPTNVFNVVGLAGLPKLEEKGRVPSPRIMDPWKIVQNTSYNPTDFGLMTINEMSDDCSSASDIEFSMSDEPLEEEPKTKPLTQAQSFIQMHLRRNDFQSLRDVLDEEGLLDDNDTFVNVPKWQPTVSFVPRHSPIPAPFNPNVISKLPLKNAPKSTKNNVNSISSAASERSDFFKKSTSNGLIKNLSNSINASGSESLKSQSARSQSSRSIHSQSGSIFSRDEIDEIAEKGEEKSILSKENAQSIIHKPNEEEDAEDEEISDIESDEGGMWNRESDQYETYEEEDFEEEEEVIDENGKPQIKYKISRGLVKKFKHSKIGDAKTKKTTNYSGIKYDDSTGRRRPVIPEKEEKKKSPESPKEEEKKPRKEYQLPEGLHINKGAAKPIKIYEGKKEKIKPVKIPKELKPKKTRKPKKVRKHKIKRSNSDNELIKKTANKVKLPIKEKETKTKSEGATPVGTSRTNKEYSDEYYEEEDFEEEDVYFEAEEEKVDDVEEEEVFEEEEDEYVYVYEEEEESLHVTTNIAEQLARMKKNAPTSARNSSRDSETNEEPHEEENKNDAPKIVLDKVDMTKIKKEKVKKKKISHKEDSNNANNGVVYVPKIKVTPKKRVMRRRTIPKKEEKEHIEKKEPEEKNEQEETKEKETEEEEEEQVINNFVEEEEEDRTESQLQNPVIEKVDTAPQVKKKPAKKKAAPKKNAKNSTKKEIKKAIEAKKKAQKEEDERALELLKAQTVEVPVDQESLYSGYKYQTGTTQEQTKEEEPVELLRSDHLGEEVELHLLEDDTSCFESKCVVKKSRLLRSNSTDSLRKKTENKRKVIPMFGEVDLSYADEIFLSHYAPSLYDKRTGKLRRNSL